MSTPPQAGTQATAFARATAVEPAGQGAYVAVVHPGWAAPTGPNGGYLAAILVRALEAEVAAAGDHRLRSLTVHFLRPPAVGALELDVHVVRAGRRTATASVTGHQGGREVLLGLAAFAAPGLVAAATWAPLPPDAGPPPAPGAPAVPADRYRRDDGVWLAPVPGVSSIMSQLRLAPRLGAAPFSGRIPSGGEGVDTGGWIGSPEEQPVDAAYAAQLTDFWWPPAFGAVTHLVAAPTIDLTIHVRADVPPGGLAVQPVLGHFRSVAAQGGLVEEDAALFLADGTLLAQSRQLALLAPVS